MSGPKCVNEYTTVCFKAISACISYSEIRGIGQGLMSIIAEPRARGSTKSKMSLIFETKAACVFELHFR